MPEIWPFRPARQINEQLSFATDVMRSASSEMRVSLRIGRQILNYSYNLRDADNARMEWLIRSYPRGDWYVPLWFESRLVVGISAADDTFNIDTTGHFAVGELVAIWASCDNVIIREIASIGTGGLTLTAAVGVDLASAFIIPVKTAFMNSGATLSRIMEKKGISEVGVSFVVRDNLDLAATPFDQYLAYDLVPKCGLIEPLAGAVQIESAMIDNEFGPIALEPLQDFIATRHTISLILQADLWDKREWLHSLRGRDRPFWLADWQKDFTLQSAITSAGTTITVAPIVDDPTDLIGRHICINDGTRTAREITNAIASGGNHILTISPLGRNAATAKVSLMRFVRLDTDLIEINHVQGFYASVSLPVVEVPE